MQKDRSAAWRLSRYNLWGTLPEEGRSVVVNLFRGTCTPMTPAALYALSNLAELEHDAPILDKLAKRGVIVDFDELAALEAMARCACAYPKRVSLTICPTMACNFNCPYCFEDHSGGKMRAETQEAVVAFAGRMLDASGAKKLEITWSGGEPLLALDVIESLSARLLPLAEARGAGYDAIIVTNGSLLTQPIADVLERARVRAAQITLDGLGAAHDRTRCFADGSPSFEVIAGKLRGLCLPFHVDIRHNVHAENRQEWEALRSFVARLARESGNDLHAYPAAVFDNPAMEERGGGMRLLCGASLRMVALERNAVRLHRGVGHYCDAHSLWCVGIDAEGRLYKCWEAAGRAELSFGSAADWEPSDPLGSAERPDLLSVYLNTAGALNDPECRECVWLPACRGGCPQRRLSGSRACLPYRDDPEAFVRALCENLKAKKR